MKSNNIANRIKARTQAYMLIFCASILLWSCDSNQIEFDASGTFEAEEIIISAEINGRVLSFPHEEGDQIEMNELIAQIDTTTLRLQRATLEASLGSLPQKTTSAQPQIAVIEQQLISQQSQIDALKVQLNQLEREKARTERLIQAESATQKQLDDLVSQIAIKQAQLSGAEQQNSVLRSQIQMQKDVANIQNRVLLSESDPIQKQIEQVNDMMNRATVRSPIEGTILTKYVNAGEYATPGKAMVKIADMNHMILRAYINGAQLSETRIGQKIDVFVDRGEEDYRKLEGTVTWISSEAEFTPKTIQTRDERADLVYAIKVDVPNDGYLKIGMYGEINIKSES